MKMPTVCFALLALPVAIGQIFAGDDDDAALEAAGEGDEDEEKEEEER